jgi:hypothetical protein
MPLIFGRDHLFDFFLANTSSPAAKKRLIEKEEWEDREDYFRTCLTDICANWLEETILCIRFWR